MMPNAATDIKGPLCRGSLRYACEYETRLTLERGSGPWFRVTHDQGYLPYTTTPPQDPPYLRPMPRVLGGTFSYGRDNSVDTAIFEQGCAGEFICPNFLGPYRRPMPRVLGGSFSYCRGTPAGKAIFEQGRAGEFI